MTKKLLLPIIIYLFISCKNDKSEKATEKKAEIISNEPKAIILEDENHIDKNSEDKMLIYLKTKYSEVYEYKESEDYEETIQQLGIRYLGNDCIDFYLYTETSPCDTKYYGKACLIQNDTICTVDKNQPDNKIAIFVKEEKEYKLSITLNKENHQTKIHYMRKDSLDTDCVPLTHVFMNVIK